MNDYVKSALAVFAGRLKVEVMSKQALRVRPNINHNKLTSLLKLMLDRKVLALPADKNLGLCLVTTKWYYSTGLKLLINPSYFETIKPNLCVLQEALQKIISKAKGFLTKQ